MEATGPPVVFTARLRPVRDNVRPGTAGPRARSIVNVPATPVPRSTRLPEPFWTLRTRELPAPNANVTLLAWRMVSVPVFLKVNEPDKVWPERVRVLFTPNVTAGADPPRRSSVSTCRTYCPAKLKPAKLTN